MRANRWIYPFANRKAQKEVEKALMKGGAVPIGTG